MLFFKLLEFVFMVLMIMLVVSQIIIPATQKRALFPLFRKQGKLEKALSEYKQRKVELELEDEVQKTKEK